MLKIEIVCIFSIFKYNLQFNMELRHSPKKGSETLLKTAWPASKKNNNIPSTNGTSLGWDYWRVGGVFKKYMWKLFKHIWRKSFTFYL